MSTPEETTARAYATVLAHALFLAAEAFARGDAAEGQSIQSAVHELMKVFKGPGGVPGFAPAMATVLAESVSGAAQPPSSRVQ